MKTMRLLIFLSFFFFCLAVTSGTACAYSTVVTFGDSLSDDGNVKRYSDGDIWVELLANQYSATLANFAHSGATTGYDNPAIGSQFTGLQWQVSTSSNFLTGLPPSDTLLTIWAGANDFLQGRNFFDAVLNMDSALNKLYAAGGRNFLVPNLPDMGNTPSLLASGIADFASFWTQNYNKNLSNMLQTFDNSHNDINLYFVDVYSLFDQYKIGSTEWSSLFWQDGFHPSSVGHNLIFQAALEATDPVPEPATMLLFTAGIVGLIGSRVRRKV